MTEAEADADADSDADADADDDANADLLYATCLGNSCRLWMPKREFWQAKQPSSPRKGRQMAQQWERSGRGLLDYPENWLQQNATLG